MCKYTCFINNLVIEHCNHRSSLQNPKFWILVGWEADVQNVVGTLTSGRKNARTNVRLVQRTFVIFFEGNIVLHWNKVNDGHRL